MYGNIPSVNNLTAIYNFQVFLIIFFYIYFLQYIEKKKT